MKIVKPQPSELPEKQMEGLPTQSQVDSQAIPTQAVTAQKEEGLAREADAKKVQDIRNGLQENQEETTEEHPEDPIVKTAKEKYSNEYLDVNQANLTEHLDELIEKYPHYGNPQKQAENAVAFEATLDYCIKNGKSTTEAVIRAIVLGTAKGIIRFEHLSYYQKYINSLPALEFVLGRNKKEIEKMSKTFKGSRGSERFKNYYWTDIITDASVMSRIQKSASENKWDHDAVASIAPGGDHNVSKLIATRPNAETSFENAYAGSLKWLQKNLKQSLKKTPQNVRRQLSFFLTLHGVSAPNRAYQNVKPIHGERYVLNDKTLQEVPRMSEHLFGQAKTMEQIDNDIWSFIEPLEPNLFAILKRPDLKLEELRDHLQKKYNFQINSFDEFYDNIDELLKKILPDVKAKKGFFLTRWMGFR